MIRRIRVYIAGPYTNPDPCANTHTAMEWWDRLWEMGFAPYCPHWSHFQHTFSPRSVDQWYAYDLEYLPACDAVLRLPGLSSGADKEVEIAESLGIPVFLDHNSLVKWAREYSMFDCNNQHFIQYGIRKIQCNRWS